MVMTTPDGVRVDPEAVRAHGETVREIAAGVDQARAAAAQVYMGREAYGQLCQFLPGMFDETQSAAVDALTEASSALDETATKLGTGALQYETTDQAAATGLDAYQPGNGFQAR
jgi:uncharacterized protein YukE